MSDAPLEKSPICLGIEGGGTKTIAILADGSGRVLGRFQAGPSNLRLLSDRELAGVFREIKQKCPSEPEAVGIGLAGVRDEKDNSRVVSCAAKVWPRAKLKATHDLDLALEAAADSDPPIPKVVVLSGTGSCCFGSAPDERRAKVGGWGHIIGDKGSGFEIGLRALKAIVYYLDRDGEWSLLGETILSQLALNEPNDLIGWVQNAGKTEIAALAKTVFACDRDPVARDILAGAADSLARDALTCARRLTGKGGAARFILAGSVLLKQPKFARHVARLIKKQWSRAVIEPLGVEAAWGGVRMARKLLGSPAPPPAAGIEEMLSEQGTKNGIPASLGLSPTELRNPRSLDLDRLPMASAVELMISEEAKIPDGLTRCVPEIVQTVQAAARALKSGGRIFYAGAGTSGRLGVLDASECPPTFRSSPEQVQGIIAGGERAMFAAVEGAEDDYKTGAETVRFRGMKRGDFLVGIAASGRTPFVWGALNAAKAAGIRTALICFNPHLKFRKGQRPGIVICPEIGPEVLTGSTRLKAGTATKQILNIISTLAMVRMGKVVSNLMVDLHPSNTKLRDRAVRILRELGVGPDRDPEDLLIKHGWDIKQAWVSAGRRKAKAARA